MIETPRQSVIEPINSELRPYRGKAVYMGIEDFVTHFDQTLTFRPEAPKTLTKETHSGVICDVCETRNITGRRYKCLVCPNFDICESCEAKEAHVDHPMVRCAKKENSYVLEKLTRKYGKLKRRCERKLRISKCLRDGGCPHHSLPSTIRPPTPEVSENKSQLSGPSEEKRKVLRFMYNNADEEVIEELVRRFEGLSLVDFLVEIEAHNRELDGQR